MACFLRTTFNNFDNFVGTIFFYAFLGHEAPQYVFTWCSPTLTTLEGQRYVSNMCAEALVFFSQMLLRKFDNIEGTSTNS